MKLFTLWLAKGKHKKLQWGTLTIKVETNGCVALSQLILCSDLVFASILNCDIFYFKCCKVRVSIFVYPQLKTQMSQLARSVAPIESVVLVCVGLELLRCNIPFDSCVLFLFCLVIKRTHNRKCFSIKAKVSINSK